MKKIKWKSFLNILFLVSVFALTLWAVFRGQDIGDVLAYLATADPMYVLVGILCVLSFILGESVIIRYLMGVLGFRVRFTSCCLYSFVGFFYSCITPSASGGQPMQVVFMRRDGLPVAVSTVVLAIVTITYKLVLVLIGAAILILRPARLMLYLAPVEPIMLIGIALNVICITGLLLLVFLPGVVRAIVLRILKLINRIRPFKDWESQMQRLDRIVNQYQGAAEFYRSHKYVIVNVFLITLAQRFALFLVTWFTYRSFHLSGHSLPLITNLQAMISVAADMLPLPGGMGISETLFLEIFEPIFGSELVLPGMVISRGISYYTQLLISAAMTVVAFLIHNKKEKGRSAP